MKSNERKQVKGGRKMAFKYDSAYVLHKQIFLYIQELTTS